MSNWRLRTRPTAEPVAMYVANAHRHMAEPLATATKRAHGMSNAALFAWVDTNLSEIGRLLVAHKRDETGDAVREAALAAAGLYACLEEMASRQPVPPPVEPSADTLRRMGSTLGG